MSKFNYIRICNKDISIFIKSNKTICWFFFINKYFKKNVKKLSLYRRKYPRFKSSIKS